MILTIFLLLDSSICCQHKQKVEPKNFSPLVSDYASSVHPENQTPVNHGCGDSNSCLSSLSRSSCDGSDSQSSSLAQGNVRLVVTRCDNEFLFLLLSTLMVSHLYFQQFC